MILTRSEFCCPFCSYRYMCEVPTYYSPSEKPCSAFGALPELEKAQLCQGIAPPFHSTKEVEKWTPPKPVATPDTRFCLPDNLGELFISLTCTHTQPECPNSNAFCLFLFQMSPLGPPGR